MCLSIILLLFSNIDFFVRPFVVEISLSFVETGAKLRQLDQLGRQLSPPVDSVELEPTGNTGAEAGARAGENWRKNWCLLAPLLQYKSSSRIPRNLDLISKNHMGSESMNDIFHSIMKSAPNVTILPEII